MYLTAVEGILRIDVDYAIPLIYGSEPAGEGHYSPPKCIGAEKMVMEGKSNISQVSASYVERQNLTMRMNMRRFIG